jgi:hypothetical protein
MAGLEPARAYYGPTDFKSVASAISPHRRVANLTRALAQTKEFSIYDQLQPRRRKFFRDR